MRFHDFQQSNSYMQSVTTLGLSSAGDKTYTVIPYQSYKKNCGRLRHEAVGISYCILYSTLSTVQPFNVKYQLTVTARVAQTREAIRSTVLDAASAQEKYRSTACNCTSLADYASFSGQRQQQPQPQSWHSKTRMCSKRWSTKLLPNHQYTLFIIMYITTRCHSKSACMPNDGRASKQQVQTTARTSYR